MAIMPAGMHHRDPGSIVFVGDEFSAGVGGLSIFFYREGVHVCAEEDCGTGPVVQDSGEAVAADACVDFIVLRDWRWVVARWAVWDSWAESSGFWVDGAVDGFEGG
jgi:hypothetical protein